MIRRTHIRKMSLRRQQSYPKYRKLAKEYLSAHPYCEHWLAENGLTEADVMGQGHVILKDPEDGGNSYPVPVPRSTEIHHRKKRGIYYLAVETFMAVSHDGHMWIHSHPKESREKGYLLC